jgi:protein gp37
VGDTSIEWTDRSTNPFVADVDDPPGNTRGTGHYCEKISPGCKHCYSSRMQPRFGLPQFQEQRGDRKPRHRLETKALLEVLRRRKPTKFFWCDMTDMFGEWVPNEWIAACFGVMAATPQHTHQVLTKRAARLPEWFAWAAACTQGARQRCAEEAVRLLHDEAHIRAVATMGTTMFDGTVRPWPLPNAWIGISAENQEAFDERWPHLRVTPAAVDFLSLEPLLGSIDLSAAVSEARFSASLRDGIRQVPLWVIVGGESGQRARPMDLAWARSIVQQCRAAGVPVFMKQFGAAPLMEMGVQDPPRRVRYWTRGLEQRLVYDLNDSKGGDMSEWPEDLRVREFPAPEPRP